MEMPDSVKLRWRKNLFDQDELQVHFNSGGEEYTNSRIVEPLRRENEELKAMFDEVHELAENHLRDARELKSKLDKAKDALRDLERMATKCDDGQYMEYDGARDIFERARKTLEEM